MVGRIQSFEKPIICNRSRPLNHRTPSVGDKDDIRTRPVDTAGRKSLQAKYDGVFPVAPDPRLPSFQLVRRQP